MTFYLHKGGVVMSSPIKHTPHTVIKIHHLTHILDTWALIFMVVLFTVYPNHIMWRHPTPLQVITTRAPEGGREKHGARQKWPRETHSVPYVPVLSTLPYLSRIDAQGSPSFLCCLRPPSHRPSSLTSVSLVPALHLLPPSKPFWPNDTHLFFPHAQTISILSDLYSLTPFLFQLSYAPLHSQLPVRDTPTKLLKHFIWRTFTFEFNSSFDANFWIWFFWHKFWVLFTYCTTRIIYYHLF